MRAMTFWLGYDQFACQYLAIYAWCKKWNGDIVLATGPSDKDILTRNDNTEQHSLENRTNYVETQQKYCFEQSTTNGPRKARNAF